MSELSEGSFVRFNDLLKALSNKTIIRTKNGKINIAGAIISGTEFDKLYLADIQDILSKLESTISPDFAPTKQLYSILDTLSSPVLNSTSVPETISSFYKKMRIAINTPAKKTSFEETLTNYVQETSETPVFMLATMSTEIPQNEDSSIYTNLMPNSSDIFEDYGMKYNGDDILFLANRGFVEPEIPINMLIYKSLYAQDTNSTTYLAPVSYEALLDFYSPSQNPNRIRTLAKEGKLTPSFIELHSELLDNIPTSARKNYIADLISESKEHASVPEDFSTEILNYTNMKLLPDSVLENNITGDFLKKQYLAGLISISRIFEIYKTAPQYFATLESVLTPDEITTAHSKDELDDDSLMYISEGSRVAYLHKNNTKFSTMMYLFLHCDGFSVTELKQLLNENRIVDTLDFYIDAGSSPERIKELYENYLIDYQCIKNLKSSGILTDKDIHKYHFSINKEKVYQDFANTATLHINGSSNVVPFSSTGAFIGISPNAPSIEDLNNSYKLLGATNESICVVSHVDEHKNSSFLDKYKIVTLKDSNLVALVPPTNTLPIYLMPYQEAAFILYNNKLPHDFSENDSIKEIKITEKLPEDLLKTAAQFEEATSFLTRLRLFRRF